MESEKPTMETSKLNRGGMTEILQRVSSGETINLTRYGKTVATIGPPITTSSTASIPAGPDVVPLNPDGSWGDTQMTVTDASHPSRRPVQSSEPQRAHAKYDTPAAQAILKKINTRTKP